MTPLTDRLRARLAFDEQHAQMSIIETMRERSPEPAKRSCHLLGAIKENARLKPLHEKLLAVVSAAEGAMARIKEERTIWPGEVDTLDDALSALRERVGSHE